MEEFWQLSEFPVCDGQPGLEDSKVTEEKEGRQTGIKIISVEPMEIPNVRGK